MLLQTGYASIIFYGSGLTKGDFDDNSYNTVAVYVDDQEAALKLWTESVGFHIRRKMPVGPKASWIEVGPKGAQTCLVIYPKSMVHNGHAAGLAL